MSSTVLLMEVHGLVPNKSVSLVVENVLLDGAEKITLVGLGRVRAEVLDQRNDLQTSFWSIKSECKVRMTRFNMMKFPILMKYNYRFLIF